MSTRGSQFSRTMQYFRAADIDEATAAIARAIVIVNERTSVVAAPKIRKQRKPRSTSAQATQDAASQSGGQS